MPSLCAWDQYASIRLWVSKAKRIFCKYCLKSMFFSIIVITVLWMSHMCLNKPEILYKTSNIIMSVIWKFHTEGTHIPYCPSVDLYGTSSHTLKMCSTSSQYQSCDATTFHYCQTKNRRTAFNKCSGGPNASKCLLRDRLFTVIDFSQKISRWILSHFPICTSKRLSQKSYLCRHWTPGGTRDTKDSFHCPRLNTFSN